MAERNEEPRGTPSTLAGVAPVRSRKDGGASDQLKSEIEQKHEASELDDEPLREPQTRPRDLGVARREPAERTAEAHEGQADEIGIEIDNAIERPKEGDAGRRSE